MLQHFLNRLWSAKAGLAIPLPRPDRPLCLIGDIHGRLDLLNTLIARIGDQPGADNVHVIVLGDMIDRGPDSAGTLTRLMGMGQTHGWTCLLGNHERMMLDFLAAPAKNSRWLEHGAATTLASFDVVARLDRPLATATELTAKMPPPMLAWLRTLPAYWMGDGIAATHAGADPTRPIDRQPARNLIWGHPDFGQKPRKDGLWVARGHLVHGEPTAADGIISVDTGAWKGGPLTAAWLDRDGLRFLQAT